MAAMRISIALRQKHKGAGNALMALGGGTILYNGYNWWRIKEQGYIPGGQAAGKKPSDFDPRQLREGTREEMEHTTDPAIASEIAMDHLMEDPLYYDKLHRAGL